MFQHHRPSAAARYLAVAVLCAPLLPGQFAGSQSPTGTATANSSISGRGAGATNSGNAHRTSVFIRGKVLLPDGRPAPAETLVQMRCVGQADMEEDTAADGAFAFQFAAVNPESRTGPRKFGITFGASIDCQVQAFSNGYFSNMKTVTGNDAMGRFDAGTIILRKKSEGEGEGYTVSLNSLKAPNAAKRAYKKGIEEARKQKWSKAEKELKAAVKAYPDYAAAWYNLGLVYEARKKAKPAREAYQKAFGADGDYLPPAVKLAAFDARDNQWEKVEERTANIIKKSSNEFPDAYFYRAIASLELQHDADAETAAREAIRLEVQKRYPQIVHILGMALAAQGKLEDAEKQMEYFLTLSRDARQKKVAEAQLTEIRRVMKEHPVQ